jgi:cysteine synthase B
VAAYGADIIYTDPLTGSDGAIIEAQEIVNKDPDRYFFGDQYNNPSNSQAHYDTTGVELWEQTDGEITHFVTGLGTTGTLMGTGRRLKEFKPDVELIAVEPSTSIHGLEGLKHMETAIIPGIYDTKFPDRKIAVDTEDAYKMVSTLGKKEGVLVGYSSGAAVKAALDVAKDLKNGVVVAILPDSGKNYLSTSFWKFY